MAKNNINDGKRFTDIKSLADVLGVDIAEAAKIAIDADAVMKIGQKTWYDWDKCLQYAKGGQVFDINAISWIEKKPGDKTLRYDVRITKGTTSNRTRISINKDCLVGFKYGAYANIGTSGDFVIFDLKAENGFKFDSNSKTVVAFCVNNPDIAKCVGNYELKRSGDLFYVNTAEKIKG